MTHGSMPAACRMPTAPSLRVTSHMSADIIIGCTISTGGPAGLAPGLASGGKYRRSRYIGTLSTIWNGDGTAPVSRPPYRKTSSPFWAVATNRPSGLVTAERSTTVRSPLGIPRLQDFRGHHGTTVFEASPDLLDGRSRSRPYDLQ